MYVCRSRGLCSTGCPLLPRPRGPPDNGQALLPLPRGYHLHLCTLPPGGCPPDPEPMGGVQIQRGGQRAVAAADCQQRVAGLFGVHHDDGGGSGRDSVP